MKQIYVTKIIVIFVPFNLFYLWIEKMFRLVWCVFIILQEPLNFANHFNEFKQIFCCNANGYMSLNTSQKTFFYKIFQSRIKQQKFNLKHCVKHSNKLQFLVFVLRTCSSYISGTGHFLLMFIRLEYINLNVLNCNNVLLSKLFVSKHSIVYRHCIELIDCNQKRKKEKYI